MSTWLRVLALMLVAALPAGCGSDDGSKPATSVPDAALVGDWDVVSVLYDDGIHSVVIGTKPTAAFGSDGTLSGSGGCNTFSGPYSADGKHVRIGPLAATQRACDGPKGANEQETGYFAALESATTVDQVGDELALLNAKGQRAVGFTRAR